MPLDLNLLDSASRLLIEANLHVAPGSGGRFQPTGFPDLGPALYKGTRFQPRTGCETVDMLLVESVQSMANRLEEVCLAGEDYNQDCQGIPYVRVLDGNRNNAFLTSSVREPHRLASPYVLAGKFNDVVFREDMKVALKSNKLRPVHIWKMVQTILDRDPGCVLHGVFLEEIDGRIRLPRLLSSYIEASSPNQANSGGVYRGEVTAKDNIPYSRQEFTASEIRASFIVHLGTLESYGLDENSNRFLKTWALYKIDRFLFRQLRLRTACEFEVTTEDISLTVDGNARNLGGGDGHWPSSEDIRDAFIRARNIRFPPLADGDEWTRRRITVVTYAVDVMGQEELPPGLTAVDFILDGFADRAKFKSNTSGKGTNKRTVNTLIISGEWLDEEQKTLLELNPEKKKNAEGEEILNPAHAVVKSALKKWSAEWSKLQKKMIGSDEAADDK